ncbi:hypothetical protein, partial [Burkholderia cenocepacia]
AERLAVSHGIREAITPLLPAKLSHIQEALAAGFGAAKDASLVAALDAGQSFGRDNFSRSRFVSRLAALSEDRHMAEIAALALDDIKLNISVERYSDARQRHDRYDDVAYHVRVRVDGLSPDARAETPVFVLPDAFGGTTGGRSIRLASSHEHKVGGKFRVSVARNGRELLTAKLTDGTWDGAMYVDQWRDAPDDSRAIGSVKAALARAIGPAVDPWVQCSIFRPDGYVAGAWRVQVSLGAAARAERANSTLVFDLPRHSQRHFQVDKGFLFDLNPTDGVMKGVFVNDEWSGDVYSNGVDETKNEMPIGTLRAILIRNVIIALGQE